MIVKEYSLLNFVFFLLFTASFSHSAENNKLQTNESRLGLGFIFHITPYLYLINTIYKCDIVDGDPTKPGRSRKFLATSELYDGFKRDLL